MRATTYARAASRMTSTLGTIREKNINLSYQVSKVSKNKILVVFLDTTSYYNSSQALLSISILLSMFGFIFFVVIVSALSGISFVPSFETTKSNDVFNAFNIAYDGYMHDKDDIQNSVNMYNLIGVCGESYVSSKPALLTTEDFIAESGLIL